MTSSIKSGTLTRNTAIGLRTKSTLASDESWEQGHKAALPYLTATSITGIVGAVVTGGLMIGYTIGGKGLPGALIVVPILGLLVQVVTLVKATIDATTSAKQINQHQDSELS